MSFNPAGGSSPSRQGNGRRPHRRSLPASGRRPVSNSDPRRTQPPTHWLAGATDPNGFLELFGMRGTWYATRVYSLRAQDVIFRVDAGAIPRLWLNGTSIAAGAPAPAREVDAQQNKVSLGGSLRAGWNTLLVQPFEEQGAPLSQPPRGTEGPAGRAGHAAGACAAWRLGAEVPDAGPPGLAGGRATSCARGRRSPAAGQ